LRNDIGGPIARTVEDAARVLEVIAGYDPADPITRASEGKIPKNYTQFLKKNGLKGARLGVFRRYIDAPTADPQIKSLVAKAIEDLKAQYEQATKHRRPPEKFPPLPPPPARGSIND
jgi:Asp-tRNA(Asn)/Glu-tRNA(Gln) amidotransferase A subunit family amidase